MRAYHSPQLFAVNHVLLRLPMPRHSPYALISLTSLELCSLSCYLLTCSFSCRKYPTIFHCRSFFSIFAFYLLFLYSIFKLLRGLLYRFFSLQLIGAASRFNLLQKFVANCPQLPAAWWAQVDSNHRPHAYQACALTT